MNSKTLWAVGLVGTLLLITFFKLSSGPDTAQETPATRHEQSSGHMAGQSDPFTPKKSHPAKRPGFQSPQPHTFSEPLTDGDYPTDGPLPPHIDDQEMETIRQVILEAKQNDIDLIEELIISMGDNGIPEEHIENQRKLLQQLKAELASADWQNGQEAEAMDSSFEGRVNDMEASHALAGMAEEDMQNIMDQEFDAVHEEDFESIQAMEHKPDEVGL